MRARAEGPVLAMVFLDLAGFGMIFPDVQLRAERLMPHSWPTGAVIGALLASTFVVQILTSPQWGGLSDRIGRKPVAVVCTAISALGMLAYGLAGSLAVLALSRLISGLGGANVAVAQAALADTYEGSERTAAIGRQAAAQSLGLFIGPAIGGFLASRYGSQTVGLTAAATSALGAVILLVAMPHARPSEHFEGRRVRVFDLRILRDLPLLRPFVALTAVAWFSLAMLEGTFARLIERFFQFGQFEFGILFSYESLLGLLIQGLLLAWVVRRVRDVPLLRSSYIAQGIGLALNPIAVLVTPWVPAMASLFVASTLYAIGAGFAGPTLNGLCSRLVPESRQGELFGMLQGARSVGFVLGPILGGVLFDRSPAVPYLFAGCVSVAAAMMLPRPGNPAPT